MYKRQAPYIAAKFPQRNIPYTFHLGSGDTYDGFLNRKLDRSMKYRIFVRAIVDTPYKVSADFSEIVEHTTNLYAVFSTTSLINDDAFYSSSIRE